VRESVSVRVRVRAAYPSDTHSEPNPIQTADVFSPEYRYRAANAAGRLFVPN